MTKKKGITTKVAGIVLALVLVACIATSFILVQITKSTYSNREADLPESAISVYLEQVKNNEFGRIYENSLLIEPHLNSKDDYVQAIKDIYKDVDLGNLMFSPEPSENDDLLYGIYDGNVKVAVVKLIKSTSGKWLLTTLFNGDNNYTVEVPQGVTIKVNGLDVGDEYIKATNQPATNFSGLKDTTNAPKVTRYVLTNLISQPEITIDSPGYVMIEDVLSQAYYVGKDATTSDLKSVVLESAKTIARYPTKDGSFASVSAITINNSDFYERLKTMDNQWYASHNVSSFSNENVLSIVQQDENSMIANVVFDYLIGAGSTTKEYNIGYQMSFLKVNGTWKVAGFAIDNELNPLTIKY